MKVKGLDGREYSLDLTGHVPLGSEEGGSSYHTACRKLLAELFPSDRRLEEVGLPGSGGLAVDFLLPSRKLAVEVQGVQHLEYTPFFHKTRLGFFKYLANDRKKKEWCEKNGIRCVCLHYAHPERWRDQILGG